MVSSSTTEEIFRKIKEEPSNTVCADCNSEEVKYASISHGIMICENCAMVHKSLGPSISFVKSLSDSWSIRQLKIMTAGGNSTLHNFFESYNMPSSADIEFKYSTVAAKYYREMLKVMAEGESCKMVTPSVEEGLMLITSPEVLSKNAEKKPENEEEKKNTGYFSGYIGSAISTTVGIGKNLFGKVREIETFQKIENKAHETMQRVGETVMWGAEKGIETIGKTVEIGKGAVGKTVEFGKGAVEKTVEIGHGALGKTVEMSREGLEWGANKGRENIEWGAHVGFNIGSKGVNMLKSGAYGAYDKMTTAAANTFYGLNIGEKTQKLKEESMHILTSLEKNTIGMVVGRKDVVEENKEEEKSVDQPERVPTPPEYR